MSYADPGGAVAVDVPDDLIVDVDADRVEQVIVNLVVNAMSHGRPPVVVSAQYRDGQVALTVRDHGNGVPAELRATLFEPFAQPAPGTDSSSVGLGLWIAAQLDEAHGGSIDHQTPPGGGAAFTLTLPGQLVGVSTTTGISRSVLRA